MASASLNALLCVMVAVIISNTDARPMNQPLVIQGRVYCDTCLAGFETSKTTYIAGAVVEVACKDRTTMDLLYTRRATTDLTGTYYLPVYEDHADQVCDVHPVSSPMFGCSKTSDVRQGSRVPLTTNNGISSFIRQANSVAFVRDEAVAGCAEVLKQYMEVED